MTLEFIWKKTRPAPLKGPGAVALGCTQMQLHLQKWRCNCICICNCICNCFPACFHQAGKQPRVRFKRLNSADMKWCLWISDDHKRWCKIAVYPLRCMRRGRDTIPIKSHLWPWRRKQPDKWTWCPAEVWKEDESEMLAGIPNSIRPFQNNKRNVILWMFLKLTQLEYILVLVTSLYLGGSTYNSQLQWLAVN